MTTEPLTDDDLHWLRVVGNVVDASANALIHDPTNRGQIVSDALKAYADDAAALGMNDAEAMLNLTRVLAGHIAQAVPQDDMKQRLVLHSAVAGDRLAAQVYNLALRHVWIAYRDAHIDEHDDLYQSSTLTGAQAAWVAYEIGSASGRDRVAIAV